MFNINNHMNKFKIYFNIKIKYVQSLMIGFNFLFINHEIYWLIYDRCECICSINLVEIDNIILLIYHGNKFEYRYELILLKLNNFYYFQSINNVKIKLPQPLKAFRPRSRWRH